MSDCCDHDDCHPFEPGAVGIPRVGPFNPLAFELAVTDLLLACGVAPDSVHTGKTARRVRDLWEKRLLGGYEIDPAEALGDGFADPREDMVVVRGIAVHGVCPHHLVPFRGVAHVAYVPGGRLHGFGRIARLVDAIGHRFTYQEWMTRDIVEALVNHGLAKGAACVIEAEQLCLLLGEDRRFDDDARHRRSAGQPRPGQGCSLCHRSRTIVSAAGRGPARRRAGRDAGVFRLLPAGRAVAQRIPARDFLLFAALTSP